jgi:hypothetical protein
LWALVPEALYLRDIISKNFKNEILVAAVLLPEDRVQ